MKTLKNCLTFLVLLLFAPPLSADFCSGHADSSGKSYMGSWVPFRNSSPERISFFDTLPDMSNWHIQAIVFGFSSTNNEQMGRYFFPFGDNLLTVSSGPDFFAPGATTTKRDIDSSNFNIYSDAGGDNNFNSTIALNPKETMVGAGIFVSKALSFKNDETVGWRIEAAAPIMQVSHDLGLIETVTNPVIDTVPNALENSQSVVSMLQAFNQPAMQYGKIMACGNKMKQTGVGDIELDVVYTSTFSEHCITETFGGIIIPTGNKPGKIGDKWVGYLWQPVVGNGHHWGLEYGNNLVITLSENDERRIAYVISLTTTYLFPNNQLRSYDLKDKSWSRYLSVWPNMAAMNGSPNPQYQGGMGTNYLTLESQVSPRFSFMMSSFINYTQGHFVGSAGYTVITRQAEHLDLVQDIPPLVIKGASSNLPVPGAQVSLARDISYQFTASDLPGNTNNNYSLFVVSPSDIDPNSAAQPAILAGALSASAGYQFEPRDGQHAVVGLAGSYRFSSNNSMPEGWTVWITGHFDF